MLMLEPITVRCMVALCPDCALLPSAGAACFCLQQITPATLASVVRTLMYARYPTCVLSGLFVLPAARNLSSREVCDLLLLAVRKDAHEFVSALAK